MIHTFLGAQRQEPLPARYSEQESLSLSSFPPVLRCLPDLLITSPCLWDSKWANIHTHFNTEQIKTNFVTWDSSNCNLHASLRDLWFNPNTLFMQSPVFSTEHIRWLRLYTSLMIGKDRFRSKAQGSQPAWSLCCLMFVTGTKTICRYE